LVQINILRHFEAEGEVSSVHMGYQKANNGEVTEHSVPEKLAISPTISFS